MDSTEKLKLIRHQIDVLDDQIRQLLIERRKLAESAKKYKKAVVDEEREKMIIEKSVFYGEWLGEIYKVIINECRKAQL